MRWAGSSAAFTAAVVVMTCASACSSPSQSATATTSSPSTTGKTPSSTSPPINANVSVTPTTISPHGHIGDTVVIPSTDQAPAMQVTLLQVLDPAQGADQFATPIAGGRFVGVQLRILPTTSPFNDDPNADTLLDDSAGNVYLPTTANLLNCPAFKSVSTYPAGKTATGCLTFQVGTNARIGEITFTPGGQFGGVSAEWEIP